MTEAEFKKKLHSKTLTEDNAIILIQYYIDNYAVLITSPVFTGYTKLEGVNVIKSGNKALISHAITQLQKHFKK
jgi:hypothetical protein